MSKVNRSADSVVREIYNKCADMPEQGSNIDNALARRHDEFITTLMLIIEKYLYPDVEKDNDQA